MANKLCDMDCFHCKFDDCINDRVYNENSRYKNRSEAAKAAHRAYQKRKRDEAKAKGLCIVCRKEKATHGAKCYACYIRQKRYDQKKNKGIRQLRKESGLCYFCGEPAVAGKKVCGRHLDILRNNIAKCNASENTKKARAYFNRW